MKAMTRADIVIHKEKHMLLREVKAQAQNWLKKEYGTLDCISELQIRGKHLVNQKEYYAFSFCYQNSFPKIGICSLDGCFSDKRAYNPETEHQDSERIIEIYGG